MNTNETLQTKMNRIQKETRIHIMQTCTDEEIINQPFLKLAMGW